MYKEKLLIIEEGPQYKPFHDLRSVPGAGRLREQVENHGRACTQVLSLCRVEQSWDFFTFSKLVTGWLVPFAGQKIPLQPGWYLPLQKIPLAENRFLQARKGAENTKEKSRECFTDMKVIWLVFGINYWL
jgi:hypothetical protein